MENDSVKFFRTVKTNVVPDSDINKFFSADGGLGNPLYSDVYDYLSSNLILAECWSNVSYHGVMLQHLRHVSTVTGGC